VREVESRLVALEREAWERDRWWGAGRKRFGLGYVGPGMHSGHQCENHRLGARHFVGRRLSVVGKPDIERVGVEEYFGLQQGGLL